MRVSLLAIASLSLLCAPVAAHTQQPVPPVASSPATPEQPGASSAATSAPYILRTPPNAAPQHPAQLVIVLPPGTQSEGIAQSTMTRSFGALASRGFTVVMPYSSDDRALLTGEDVASLFSRVSAEDKVLGDRAVIIGIQNGARAAFEYTVAHPERVSGLVLMPGMPPRDWASGDERKRMLDSLRNIPVAMFVGSEDARWRDEMQLLSRELTAAGITCTLTVVEGDGHSLPSLTPDRIADALNRLSLLAAGITPEQDVGRMLDAWHDAAARADENAYFAHFADPGSIFMGTDATERWTATEFRAWAKPYFDRGRAWAFKVVERHTYLSPDESIAWFDEVLDTPNMGPCRGTGVAVRRDGVWKVAHYNLTVPVPNAIVDRVVEMVKQELENPAPANGVAPEPDR